MSELKSIDLIHGEVARLEELVDRESLTEVCRSFFDLFGISIRVFSASGSLLADVHEEREICRMVNRPDAGKNSLCKDRGASARSDSSRRRPVFYLFYRSCLSHSSHRLR